MNTEVWKDIRGYEGLYEVSDLGRVRSLGRTCNSKNGSKQQKRVKILVQEITVYGYCRVRLFNHDGKAKHFAVHRLVMAAFMGESDLQVNHKNEIKTDNRLVNLEYVTPCENSNYGTRNQRISKIVTGKHVKPVAQIGEDGAVMRVFSSRTDAERATGIEASKIGNCCSGTRQRAGGYKWRNI